MAQETEKLILEILAENKDAIKKILEVDKSSEKFAKKSEGLFDKMQKNWLKLTTAIGGTVLVMKDIIQETVREHQVQAQLASVLKSTGQAAGLTAKEINEMAAGLSKATTFSQGQIVAGQNLLLTFTRIGKDVFPAATETILNMSEALGQDLKASALQLGKALNDPIEGVGALRRVGVQFTAEQENMIKALLKTGDIMGAQRIILKELSTEFGGSARAQAETFGGSLQQMTNTINDMKVKIGEALIPVIQVFVKILKGAAEFFTSLPKPIQTIIVGIVGLAAAFKGLSVAMTLLNFNPVVLGITAVVAVMGGLIYLMAKANEHLEENIALNESTQKAMKKTSQELEADIKKYEELIKANKAAGLETKKYEERLQELQTALINNNKVIGAQGEHLDSLKKKKAESSQATKKESDLIKAQTSIIQENVNETLKANDEKKGSMNDYFNFIKDQYAIDQEALAQKSELAISGLAEQLNIQKSLIEQYMTSTSEIEAERQLQRITTEQEAINQLTELRAGYQAQKDIIDEAGVEKEKALNDKALLMYRTTYSNLNALQKIRLKESYDAETKFWADIKTTTESAVETTSSVYADGIAEMIVEGKKFHKNFGDFFTDLIHLAEKMIIKLLLIKALKGIFGGVFGLFSEGGVVKKFSRGGMARKTLYAQGGAFAPKGTDTVPAMLTPGERVLSVDQNRVFEDFVKTFSRAIQIPKVQSGGFQTGGVAGSGAGATVIQNTFNITGEVIDDFAFKNFTKKIMLEQERILEKNEVY